MSPILKRDVAETVRQARRLAAAAGLKDYDEHEHEYELNRGSTSRPSNTNEDSASFEAERDSMEMAEIAEEGRLLGSQVLEKGGIGKWADLRGLLFSSTPSLLFSPCRSRVLRPAPGTLCALARVPPR
ncbi:hypothetical protein CcaverHIS002_0406420 [Cutaneotrichosporon cavernicola]|nr:hypothetical protein CcaverHIS002_0406420 [Cutaneotrichosporon cavernicola]